jgi:hypothetical protein
LKIVKEGHYDQIDAFVLSDWDNHYDSLVYKLLKKSQSDGNMALISGRTVKPNLNRITSFEKQWIGDFIIDKYEVTNEEFKEFVDDGGYKTPNLNYS